MPNSSNSSSNNNQAKFDMEEARRFFDRFDALKTATTTNISHSFSNPRYSTMSLPRKMPVKKLVSAFNNQVKKC